MAEYTVKQTIVTPTRRFLPGAIVREDDLDGPLSAADWQRIGFLAGDAPPAPMAASIAAADLE